MSHKDIKAIIVLLATQGLINLGSLPDPVQGKALFEPEKARIFLDLLKILRTKTRGNLDDDESEFLEEAIGNLQNILELKTGDGEPE